MFAACNKRAACRNAEKPKNPSMGALVVLGSFSPYDHGLGSHQGVFLFQAGLHPLAVRLHGRLGRIHYRQPSELHHGMRRMVQFLNPQDWLNAQVWGPALAALAWASLQGAGVILSLLHLLNGVGGGFRWNLPTIRGLA